MQKPEANSVVRELLARLTAPRPDHENFRGPPVDITGLSPLDLGRLWGAIQRARFFSDNRAAREVAFSILQQAERLHLVPALDEHACAEVFRATRTGDLQAAVEHLSYMACPPPETLAPELRRILGDPGEWAQKRYQASALARLTDDATCAELRARVHEKYADCPYVLQEFAVLSALSANAIMGLANARFGLYYWPGEGDEESDPATVLSDEPAYVEFARQALITARQRLDEIHAGAVAYSADCAFSVNDTPIIARATRVAALRDEQWFGELIAVLLPKSSVAPTDARSAPSQSLAIALGHSVQGVPTPESVQALREALRVARHAGIKKKLTRNLKPAERALAERPEVALRLTADAKAGKAQQAILATCLEAGFWQALRFDVGSWRAQLGQTALGALFARSLIWRAHFESGPPNSFMLDSGPEPTASIECSGQRTHIDGATQISLWHPLLVEEPERDAWRSLIAARQIRQLVRQAYREYYVPEREELAAPFTEMFAGHVLSIRPLIGLARRQGWQIDKFDGLQRTFADMRATFQVGADLYPGLEGWCDSGPLRFQKQDGTGWVDASIREIPPVVFSEICRAVDLLVSVTTFAIEDGAGSPPATVGELGVTLAGAHTPPPPASLHARAARSQRIERLAGMSLNETARMRREAVKRVFAREVAAGSMLIDDRHVRVGAFAVHLGTARVTQEGAPIDLQLPAGGRKLAAVPWLPYDETLLQKIADSVRVLLGNAPG